MRSVLIQGSLRPVIYGFVLLAVAMAGMYIVWKNFFFVDAPALQESQIDPQSSETPQLDPKDIKIRTMTEDELRKEIGEEEYQKLRELYD